MNISHISRFGNNFYALHDDFYWDTFHEFASDAANNYREAYELTEQVWQERFGVHRFVDYYSFKVGKHRRYNGKKGPVVDKNQLKLFDL